MTAPASSAATPPELPLSSAEACDLDLLLADVLPDGWLLGDATGEHPVSAAGRDRDDTSGDDAGDGRRAAVRVDADLAAAAVEAGSLQLRDVEHTPVGSLEAPEVVPQAPTPSDGSQLLLGEVQPGVRRESGAVPGTRLDLADPALRGRAVLLLGRAPLLADEPDLLAWAARVGTRPLVLVPEDGDTTTSLPPALAWKLAHDLTERIDLAGAEIGTIPLFSGGGRDDVVADLLAHRLDARPFLHLSPSDDTALGRQWTTTARALRRGEADEHLPGVDPTVEERLRRWRPRRSDRGLVVLMSGLSGSGKSTLARDLDSYLRLHSERGVTLLDGDVVRRLLSSGLGFDVASRELNVRRIGWVAARIAEHGGTAICSPIAPFARTRDEVRHMVEQVADLVLVHVSTPLAECERRDLKGLYARARRGEIPEFTGISSPYETPTDADVQVDTSLLSRQAALDVLVDHLRSGGWLTGGTA